jgi:methyltransferase (TIGR00027 family)
MALFRALESRRPAALRLFEDPFAAAFLDPGLRAVAALARFETAGSALRRFIDHRWPGALTSGIARTRLIDDETRRALCEGAEQVVILGAGFDCRALRLPELRGTAVFEVDHPSTQSVKIDRLRRAPGGLPPHVRFVPLDFGAGALETALASAGHRAGLRTWVLWEGVTNYLTPEAVDSTLRWIARSGGEALFTYVHRGVIDRSVRFFGDEPVLAALRRRGEPWTFGLDPAELAGYLAQRGLDLVWDVGASEYRSRYFGGAAERMRGYEFYRAARAKAAVTRGCAAGRGAPPTPPGCAASRP